MKLTVLLAQELEKLRQEPVGTRGAVGPAAALHQGGQTTTQQHPLNGKTCGFCLPNLLLGVSWAHTNTEPLRGQIPGSVLQAD